MKPLFLSIGYNLPVISKLIRYFILFFLLIHTRLYAQDATPKIFDALAPLEITLEFDMKKLMIGKYKEEYLPAKIIYQEAANNNTFDTVALKVRARGHSRKRICQFPPLRLNFSRKKTSEGTFSGLDKVKLVCYCKNNDLYEQYILKEYYVYKMYELFSERSFKTRLLKIKYQDSRGKKKTVERYGFIIEHEDNMAERLKVHPYETSQIHPANCDNTTTTTLTIFQYMIGNTDWSVAKQHNVKLFVPSNESENQRIFPVPYDFDYSGVVNAHYAVASNTLPIEKITDRYYLGYCKDEELLKEVMVDFKDKKEAVFSLLEKDVLLEEKEKRALLLYLNEFYSSLEKENQLLTIINKQCKG